MLRKIATAIILSAVPVLSFGVAQLATSANAFAAGKTTTCTGGAGTLTFASPGLSDQGTASASKKSTATTSSGPISCSGKHSGSGTLASSSITTKSKETCASDSNPPSPCPSGDHVDDSAAQYVEAVGTLYQSVPTTSWTIGAATYVAANTGSSEAGTGSGAGKCPSGELGFVLSGHLSAPAPQSGKATTITACLETDSGTNTTGSFYNDLVSEVADSNTSIVIAQAGTDPAASSIVFK